MILTEEQIVRLEQILDWQQKFELSETWRHRVLTYGTNTDKVVLQLWDLLDELIREEA